MINTILSKNNAKIKYACSLKEKKYRLIHRQFLVESKKALELALKAGVVSDVFTLERMDLPDNINQYIVSEEVLKKISYSVNPELVFIANELHLVPKDEKRILYLDNINDPGNLGTIIRTALAFDFSLVGVSKDTVSIYNEKVIASSKGAIFLIPIIEMDLKDYKNKNTIIVTTLSDDSISLFNAQKYDKFVLVLGNESHGVSEASLSLSDVKVKIDISNIDSLNVAVAGGIAMAYFSNKS